MRFYWGKFWKVCFQSLKLNSLPLFHTMRFNIFCCWLQYYYHTHTINKKRKLNQESKSIEDKICFEKPPRYKIFARLSIHNYIYYIHVAFLFKFIFQSNLVIIYGIHIERTVARLYQAFDKTENAFS